METKFQNFDELKNVIITRAQAQSACSSQVRRVIESIDAKSLLQVIFDNMRWSVYNKIVNGDELKSWFGVELCNSLNIYFEGPVRVDNSTSKHFSNSTSEHYGNSTSEHYGNSTSKHYGNSTSKHYGNSTSEHYDNSTSEHYDNSTSKHYDNSTSKHFGNTTCYAAFSSSHVLNERAILRDVYANKIYIKKSASEIVYID